MILSHKIRIYPNEEQKIFLQKSCDVARFSYNWALEEWKKQYDNGNKPNWFQINKKFNSIKRNEFPFVCEVSKCCALYAIMNLGKAFNNFFHKQSNYPRFKKKKQHNSFKISNDRFSLKDKWCKLPKMKPIRLSQKLRFDGKIMGGTIIKNGNKWYFSIDVEIVNQNKLPKTEKAVGIDLGIKTFVTTNDNLKFKNSFLTKKDKRKIRLLNKKLSRQKKNSKRRKNTIKIIQNCFERISNKRKDFIHKTTKFLIKNYDKIVIEDLNVRGMVKNHNLAEAIMNTGFYEFKYQIKYKCKLYGKEFYQINRFFPSSKKCSCCDFIKNDLTLNNREWTCPNCLTHHDRDINAARNIIRQALPKYKYEENKALVTEIDSITKLDLLNRKSLV